MANRYWVGGTGNWSDATNHWATSTGGAPGAGNLPTSSDNVYFDANSGTGTMTSDSAGSCLDFDTTNSSITTFYADTSGDYYQIYGSLILKAGISFTTGIIEFYGTGTHTVTTNGVTITLITGAYITFRGSGTYTLQDDLSANTSDAKGTIRVLSGTFDSNEKAITTGRLNISAGTSDFTNSYITCNYGTDWVFQVAGAATVTFTGSTIKLTGALTANRTWLGGGKTYNNVWNATTGAYAIVFDNSSNTFNDFKLDAGREVNFTAGTTQTITTLTALGTSGSHIIIHSTSATDVTLTKAGGGVISGCDYIDFTDIVGSPDLTWYVGANSTATGCTNIYLLDEPVSAATGNFFNFI